MTKPTGRPTTPRGKRRLRLTLHHIPCWDCPGDWVQCYPSSQCKNLKHADFIECPAPAKKGRKHATR